MDKLIVTTPEELSALLDERIRIAFKHYTPQNGQGTSDEGKAAESSRILSLEQFCNYTGLSRQTVYKLTSAQKVPHSKRGKRLYFDRQKIDEWLLENQVATQSEILKKSKEHLSKNHSRRRA